MSFWTRVWGKENSRARVAGGPLATSPDRIHGCWRGWEQGWGAQCALSHLPGVQQGQKCGNLGEKGHEQGESLGLEARWRDSL